MDNNELRYVDFMIRDVSIENVSMFFKKEQKKIY